MSGLRSEPDVVGPASAPAESRGGLSTRRAAELLARWGPNELPRRRRSPLGVRMLRQFLEPMALLLIVAAVVAAAGLGESLDALAILAIVVVNAVIALIQEGRAANALEALRRMGEPTATVVRDGRTRPVPSAEIVPGDLVVLAAGDRVPADVRLVQSAAVEIDEAILTGESLPVAKGASAGGHVPTGPLDQVDVAFSGTMVLRGSARGVVIDTGPRTQLGRIASRLDNPDPQTPLQRDLRSMTLRLGVIAGIVAVVVFGITAVRLSGTATGLQTAFLSAVALAVAAVPEGLPTVVTVALTLGVRRMASRGSIVRRLPAVETLGSTTVVLTDKTGTLTQNRLRVDAVFDANGAAVDVTSLLPDDPIARIMALCNDATLDPPMGDPMDIVFLEALGPALVDEVRAAHPRIGVIPFDSQRKRMDTFNRFGGRITRYVKGAPEAVMEAAGAAPRMDTVNQAARGGARVLALAHGTAAAPVIRSADACEGLTIAGFVALRDGVRAEAAGAIREASRAGIRVIMVTGDHPATACAVASEVGMSDATTALTGADVRRDGFPDDPLTVPVYARFDPDQKLALTGALQNAGHVVAVTGDGVNDAPALQCADIGVAMGKAGSDVAREAADMVVTDDNLATIVVAIREGRGIYDNVRKVVEYLVSGNISEILVVVTALLAFPGLGVPLLPLQLLWINLLTDGFPAIALGADPVDPTLMDRPPRRRGDRLLSAPRIAVLSMRGIVIAAAAITGLVVSRYLWDQPWASARSSMFSILVIAHLLYAFAVRAAPRGARANRWLVAAVAGGIGLQALIVVVPVFHDTFGTVALSARDWLMVAVAGSIPAMVLRGIARRRDAVARPAGSVG